MLGHKKLARCGKTGTASPFRPDVPQRIDDIRSRNGRLSPLFRAFLILTIGIPLGWAVGPEIGFLTSNGPVQLDSAPVDKHGTLFDGSIVETHMHGAQLEVPRDAKMSLSSDSRAQVFRDHLILERGETDLLAPYGYFVEARGLRVGGLNPGTVAIISLRKSKRVLVTARGGPVRVTNPQGELVVSVQEGRIADVEALEVGTPTSSTPSGGAAPAATASAAAHGISKTAVIIIGAGAAGGAGAVVGLTRSETAPISQ